MAEEVAKLKATIEIDAQSAQNSVNIINQRIDTLNKKMQEGEKLTAKENAELKRLVKTLADLGNSANKTQIAEEKIRATREKSANEVKNKSIINEQKLATERERTKKVTMQAESAELRLAKQKESANKTASASSGIWSKLSTRFAVAGLAVNAITGLFNKLTSSIKEASTEALDFEKKMSLVNTITNVSKGDLKDMGINISELGKKLGKAPSEMAMGMYDVASSTDDTVDRLKILEQATKASVAGFTDVGTAVDTGIGMMNAYGLSQEDLSKIYDLQFKTIDRGIIKYDELKEALGNMMSSAVNAKVPMEEMLGQLAFLTKSGQNYAKSSVALARTYDTVFEKGDKLKKFLNVDVADGNNNLRSTTDIMADMAKELSKFDEISKINLLEEIGFSDRSSRAIIALMSNVEGVRKEINLVSDATGSMEQAFNDASENTLTDWEKVKASIGKETYEWLNTNKENVSGLLKAFSSLISLTLGLASVLGTVWTIVSTISNISGLSKILSFFGKIIELSKEGNKSTNNFVKDLKENYAKAKEVDDPYSNIIRYNQDFVKNNKEFFAKIKEQRDNDLLNADSYNDRFRAGYEYKLAVINEYNKQLLTAVEAGLNEKARLENSVLYSSENRYTPKVKPKGLEGVRTEDYQALYNAIISGKTELSSSEIIGNKKEQKKYTDTSILKNGKKNLETLKKQQTSYENSINKIISGLGNYNTTEILGYLDMYLKTTGSKVNAKDVGVETGLKHYETPEKEKKTKEEFSYSKALSEFKLEMNTKGIKEGTEKYLEEYKSFLDSSSKSLIDLGDKGTKDLATVKTEYAKVTSQLDELKKYDYNKEYANFLELMKSKGITEGSEEFNSEFKKLLENSVEKMVEQKQDTSEITKKLEQINLKEEADKHLKAYNDIFKEEEQFADYIKKTGKDINSEENSKKVVEIWKKQIERLIELAEGSDKFNSEIEKIQSKINFSNFKVNLKQGQTIQGQDEITLAFKDNNMSQQEITDAFNTLAEKYKDNEEVMASLEQAYENATSKVEKFSDKLSASAGFVSELSSVLDNEFLGSISNVMNGISSMSSVISSAGGIANVGFGGWMSVATSAVSIAGTLSDMWSGDGGVAEKQAEAAQVFEDAVETFKTTVENYSTKEKIDYANLTKPSSLSEITSGIGNGDVGWGASDFFDVFDKPDNATYDISSLKAQLTNAGYGDLAGQLDSIMGKYAQYSRSRNWYGKSSSYISGYDTAGFLKEVNALIEEAYQTNLDAYKEQVGLTSDSFVSAIKEGMENATDLDISSMIESAFYDSYSAMIGEVFGENIGDTISETIFDILENAGVTQSDLSNMSVSEQIAYIQSLMDNSSTYLSEVFDELGLSVTSVTDSFNELKNANLPSVIKLALLENQASTGYNSTGSSSGKSGTTINVATVYGSVDSTFVNMVNKAVGYNNVKRTGN